MVVLLMVPVPVGDGPGEAQRGARGKKPAEELLVLLLDKLRAPPDQALVAGNHQSQIITKHANFKHNQ